MSIGRIIALAVVVLTGLFIGTSFVESRRHHQPGHGPAGHGAFDSAGAHGGFGSHADHAVDPLPQKHASEVEQPGGRKSRRTPAPPVAFVREDPHNPRDDEAAEANAHAASRGGGTNSEARSRRQDAAAALDSTFRGVTCPPYDPTIDALQIPLKHLPRKKKTSVAEKYNRRAGNCVSNGIWNKVTIKDHHKILHHMVRLGRIKRGSFVLDWGSGCGHSLQFLSAEYSVHGVGIDVSNLTIAYARENTTKANMHCVADGSRLQWIASNTFDHVLSFGSIYHVYNRTTFCHVLRQLARIVKPGGTIYNGWTENGEYHRKHLSKCFSDMPMVQFKVYEEAVEFKDVEIFPLKAHQDTPNTYSLVLTKTADMPPELDDRVDDIANIPIECGVHRCEPRGSGLIADDTPKPDPRTPPPLTPLPTLSRQRKRAMEAEAAGAGGAAGGAVNRDSMDDALPPPTEVESHASKKHRQPKTPPPTEEATDAPATEAAVEEITAAPTTAADAAEAEETTKPPKKKTKRKKTTPAPHAEDDGAETTAAPPTEEGAETPEPTTKRPKKRKAKKTPAPAEDEADHDKTGGDDGDAVKPAKKAVARSAGGSASWDTLQCPPNDGQFDHLQIPLKHLPRGKKTSVAEKYNRRAHNCNGEGVWHKVPLRDHHKILKVAAGFMALEPGMSVFDWGCGCGHKLKLLHDSFDIRGFGIDVSNATIAYARENTTSGNKFCVADGTQLGWIPDNTFDRAFSFGSIYHVYNTTTFCHVLREMVRIVKPGGMVYNGWTENGEFKRTMVSECVAAGDWMPNAEENRFRIIEEKDAFKHVEFFPLKQYRKTPNTYSLLVTKAK